MGERDDLLASAANTIKTYRSGELNEPTPAHVDRWLSQFTPTNQLPLLREFDHVMKQTFLTKDTVSAFLRGLVTNEKLAGRDPKSYWAHANVLRIQKAGQSQNEMVKMFTDALIQECGLEPDECGTNDGDFIYLDDVLFSGGRVGVDLSEWIATTAPQTAQVHVIVMAYHLLGQYYAKKQLDKAIKTSGKKIKISYWRLIELENRRYQKDSSDVLWPALIPNDAAVQAYIGSEERFPLDPRNPGGALGMFSSEAGRQVLESEFLIMGVKIRSQTQSPKSVMRPLGFGHFGVGFGSLLVTYRNCPNNCPLALWWGDPEATSGALHWYPLLSRKTYAAQENVFNVFDDLTV